MIEVNLLPLELRRVEHTPLPRFLVIIIGTAVVLTMAAVGSIISLRTVPDLRARDNSLTSDIGRSQVAAAAYDKILDQIAETQDRKTAIAEVWRTRIMWSEKLSQIAEMTPAFVGLTELTLEESRQTGRGGEENGGTLTLQSICAGTDHSRIANVRRIFQGQYRVAENSDPWVGKRFYGSFQDLLPTGTQMVEVKDCVETEALKFSLEMPLKPASVRLEEALAATRADMNAKAMEEGAIPAAKKDVKPKAAPGTRTEGPAKPAAKGTTVVGTAAAGAGSVPPTGQATPAPTSSGNADMTRKNKPSE
jgi:Tfp pilus assembly protein PilN